MKKLKDIVINDETRTKCSCGWSMTIHNKHKRVICKNCGNYIFLNKNDEFKYKLNGELNATKKNK